MRILRALVLNSLAGTPVGIVYASTGITASTSKVCPLGRSRASPREACEEGCGETSCERRGGLVSHAPALRPGAALFEPRLATADAVARDEPLAPDTVRPRRAFGSQVVGDVKAKKEADPAWFDALLESDPSQLRRRER